MENLKINLTLQNDEMHLPKEFLLHENYNPTFDFDKTYTISKKDIKNYEIKSNKFLSKKQWSSENALLKAIIMKLGFNDGLRCDGNMPIFNILNPQTHLHTRLNQKQY
tara:strand:- start:16156 stop:16479 length:324 start_codon:yes stop_codon:yes gene_type:complete